VIKTELYDALSAWTALCIILYWLITSVSGWFESDVTATVVLVILAPLVNLIIRYSLEINDE